MTTSLLALLLSVGLWSFLRPLPSAATRPSVGFSSYYTAARLLREGTELTSAWEDDWFGREIRRFAPTVSDIWRPNPPSAALLALPVSWFAYRTARVLWTVGSLLILLALWWWSVRTLRPRGRELVWLLALFLLFDPFRACLWYGQVYIALAGLLTLVIRAERGGEGESARPGHRTLVSGVAIGLLIALKTALLPLLLGGLQRRRRRTLIAMVTTIGCVASVSVVLGGTAPWRSYLAYLMSPESQLARPERTSTAYQSLFSLCSRVTSPDAQWNPAPWLDLPWIGIGAYLVGAFLLGWTALRHWARGRDRDLALARLALLQVILSPWTLDYHYPLVWPVLVVWGSAAPLGRWNGKLIAGLAVVLLLIPARWYCAPGLQEGLLALFAYPKLYGALLLFALCGERTSVSCPS
ncbi:MAG: DUF2029 domain-containing protein, partial [Candidatus Eisenbacteria bacterium]|nr:DUF2029 domain-containing protein [Candidatus Eisenbacteria bacterium]